jgi:hypothetical protein
MKNILYILLLSYSTISFCQTEKIDAVKMESIDIQVDVFIGLDGLGSSYFIKDNIFLKRKNNQTFEYKNLSLGKISKVDIQNPLKIVLFYENFNTVILLDNQLNEIQKIAFLENEDTVIAVASGMASQNRLWIYDMITQKIGLFDYSNNTFLPVTASFEGNLKYYESDFNRFQWIDTNLNWNSCDIFGKITTQGKVNDFDQIQVVSEQTVIFSKDQKLFLQDLKKNSITPITTVENSFKNFCYKDQILSIFTESGITNYKITLP